MSGPSDNWAVKVEHVGKQYRLGELPGLRAMARGVSRRSVSPNTAFAALDDVTFDVAEGEAFALLGQNGSGKSTLLQILSRITLPSSGKIRFRGRVLPLLAVGTGFHQDLTARENVALFGTILGMSRRDILRHVPAVAEFAELESHIDTPVKRFSDGMQARLSFALGMVLPADIYIFDEVLAVVDDDFRNRCIQAIHDLSNAGKTVMFVSHDLNQVRRLCARAAWLSHGRLVAVGDVEDITTAYAQETASVGSGSA